MVCKNKLLQQIKGGLIVSCQALENEPLHVSGFMGKMALAAMQGGAVGIRANTFDDIREIRREVDLPIIGIIKKNYNGSPVYITPTINEVDEVVKAGADIVAVDATQQKRPDGLDLQQFIKTIRRKYSTLIMADISTFEEGLKVAEYGVDMVGTTLSGYTSYTLDKPRPDYELIKNLSEKINIPVIAEGRIREPQEAAKCIELGAFTVVVGGAITRPQQITERFVFEIKKAVK